MPNSTLANLNSGTPVAELETADLMYMEDASDSGNAKPITAGTIKTFCSASPTLVTPTLSGAFAGGGNDLNDLGVIFLTEQAAAEADVAGKGQIWVETQTPNILRYTDDAGTDFYIRCDLSALLRRKTVTAGITADVGSAQGGGALTTEINQIATCATTGDAVTLPAAAAGIEVTIINNGAEAADVFPASGDNLGAGLNLAASLAAGDSVTYVALDATNWFAI